MLPLAGKPSLQTAPPLKKPADPVPAEVNSSLTTDVVVMEPVSSSSILASDLKCSLGTVHTAPANYTIFQPKATSPLLTNSASSAPTLPTINLNPSIPTAYTIGSSSANQQSTLPNANQQNTVHRQPNYASAPQNLAEKLRFTADKNLKRVAHITIAASGRPHVVIPDEVFQRGAELHIDFIICYFCGRAPPFKQIQSVINHM